MRHLPVFIPLLFIITTLLTAWQFYRAANKSTPVIVTILSWLVLQGIIGLTGFYRVTSSLPPRFALLIGPGLILSVLFVTTRRGRNFLDTLNIRKLTLLHAIRVPVEITLYYLCAEKYIPVLMTFGGNNYDIISGLTAPVMYYLVFVVKKFNNTTLLVWNFACLGLLINILVIAILSAPTPFQQLAFDQPNVGVSFFPFTWLPSLVVPIVLVSHLSAIKQLIKNRKQVAGAVFDHAPKLANE
jgi:hypothetical protein